LPVALRALEFRDPAVDVLEGVPRPVLMLLVLAQQKGYGDES
jgi:hypothetical protein